MLQRRCFHTALAILQIFIFWEPSRAGYALNGERLKTSELFPHSDGRIEGGTGPWNLAGLNWRPILPMDGNKWESKSGQSSNKDLKLCGKFASVFLLIVVKSRYSHFSQRLAIRHSWGRLKKINDKNIVTVFFFGKGDNPTFQKSISVERVLYEDIVQVDVTDNYSNSALITQHTFQWVVQDCEEAIFVMITQDDVIIDLHKLVPNLEYQMANSGVDEVFTVCYLFPCCDNMTAINVKFKSLNLTSGVYSGKLLPEFCAKNAYAASGKVIAKFNDISTIMPPFVPEEVWVSLLAKKAGVTLPDTSSMFGGIGNNQFLLKQYLSANYLSSRLIFGIVGNDYPDKEALIVKNIWSVLESHYKDTGRKQNSVSFNVVSINRSDSQDIVYFTISFMLVDIVVIICIFLMVFMKRKAPHKRFSRANIYSS